MVKEKLSITELGQEVAQVIERRIPQAKVDVREVIKNNDLVLHGVTIRDTSKATNVSPTIYLENYFDKYLDDVKTVEEIADQIIECNNALQIETSIDSSMFTDFDNVKNNLGIKLVNTKKNEKFLESVPHKEFLDLSVIYQVEVRIDENTGSFTIRNELMNKYGITLDELHKEALDSMKNRKVVTIIGMIEKIASLTMPAESFEKLKELNAFEILDNGMIYISNETKILGATAILYEDTLKKLADIFKEDYYILPSSIHEVLAVKATGIYVEDLKAMVKETNAEHVEPDEVLSDNVYHYNIVTGELSIA